MLTDKNYFSIFVFKSKFVFWFLLQMLSQGLTLMCLQQHLDDENFDKVCKEQVLHLSSVQAGNIKFDRQLYLACTIELNKFCPTVTFGLGQAYECLMQHKFDPLISQQVRTLVLLLLLHFCSSF